MQILQLATGGRQETHERHCSLPAHGSGILVSSASRSLLHSHFIVRSVAFNFHDFEERDRPMPPPVLDKVLQRLKFPTAIDSLTGSQNTWLLSDVLDAGRQFRAFPVRHPGDPLPYITSSVAIAPLSGAGPRIGTWIVRDIHVRVAQRDTSFRRKWRATKCWRPKSLEALCCQSFSRQTTNKNVFISIGNADKTRSFEF